MAKPKSNEDFDLHPGIWCGYIVDEFLGEKSTRAIPECWGGNSTQRNANAVFLAIVSIHPGCLETAKSVVEQKLNLPGHLCRQIGFAQLFSKAPDFFVEFIQYVRKRGADRKRIEMIARELHFQGDKLVFTSSGEKRHDKEIAAELESQFKPKKAIHPSAVGKARALLAKMKLANKANRIERYLDFDYSEMVDLLSLIDNRVETKKQKSSA